MYYMQKNNQESSQSVSIIEVAKHKDTSEHEEVRPFKYAILPYMWHVHVGLF